MDRIIRTATLADLDAVAAVEAACFPPAEAATLAELTERIEVYGDHFWLLERGGRLVAFVDGMTTDRADLTDEMYADASLHDEHGAWQMIFGVNTLPEYRRRGYAAMLIQRAIADAGVSPDVVDHINAHATSTHLGDICETGAVRR